MSSNCLSELLIAPLAKNSKVLPTLSEEGIASGWMAEESRYSRAQHTKVVQILCGIDGIIIGMS
jgi:hypothetical protein